MDLAEGIRRLAALIRWTGYVIGGLLFVLAIALAAFGSTDRLQMFALYGVSGAVVAGIGYALAWVIEGFAGKRRTAEPRADP